MDYRTELQKGIAFWTEEKYEEACESFMGGLESFMAIEPTPFLLAGVTPGTNLLGTICDGLNEGQRLWDAFAKTFSRQPFPFGGYHIGWMAAVLVILLKVTQSNWLWHRNARGYVALVELDDLYLGALRPADRRSLHRKLSAAVFEQALGKALAWDIDAGPTIAEHFTSPLANDILGSLYPVEFARGHHLAKPYDAARGSRISDYIDSWQRSLLSAAQDANLEESFADSTAPFPNLGRFDSLLYKQLKMEPALSQSIRGMPQANVDNMREALRDGEALVITNAYEENFLFFLLSKHEPTRCYLLQNFGSIHVRLAEALAGLDDPAEKLLAHVAVLYYRITDAVNPILNCLGLHIPGIPPAKPLVPLNVEVSYIDLGALRGMPAQQTNLEEAVGELRLLRETPRYSLSGGEQSLGTLGSALDSYQSILWVSTFPLNMAPLHVLASAQGKSQTCSYVPSGSLVVGLRCLHLGEQPVKRALIFSNPTSDLDLCSQEGREVTCLLRERGIEVVHKERSEATRKFFVEQVDQFDLFHYCGHGYGESSDGLKELLLCADGPLEVFDVIRAKPKLRLAFLNSCSSGQQEAAPYGELSGPANLFLASGVATILAPIVPVRDDVALAVSRFFYDQIGKGLSIGEAACELYEAEQSFEHRFSLVYRVYGLPETRILA
jgi:CHAT domain